MNRTNKPHKLAQGRAHKWNVSLTREELTALYRLASKEGRTASGWLRETLQREYEGKIAAWPPAPPLLSVAAMCLALGACWTAGPVVADVRQLPDGSLEVKRCMVQTSWAPPGVTQDVDLVECKRERRKAP